VRYMLLFQGLLTLAFACLLIFSNSAAVFYGGQIAFGLSTAFVYSSSLYYAMHTSSGGARQAALHEALIGAGIALGPALGALAGTGENSLPIIGVAVSGALVTGWIVLGILGRKAGLGTRAFAPSLQSELTPRS